MSGALRTRMLAGAQLAVAMLCLVVAAFASDVARAQDPAVTVVQNAALKWLAYTDKLEGEPSWQAAGEKFRTQMPLDVWSKTLEIVRGPLGAVSQRALVNSSFLKEMPGVPDGEYALLVFRTAFENKTEGHESVTLEREKDGTWRVVGYFLR